jgi:hypothetical protein
MAQAMLRRSVAPPVETVEKASRMVAYIDLESPSDCDTDRMDNYIRLLESQRVPKTSGNARIWHRYDGAKGGESSGVPLGLHGRLRW